MPWLSACLLALTFNLVTAQIPGFGGCPTYDAMPEFKKNLFLGKWYESERFFDVTEVASKCIAVNYEKQPSGKIVVKNAYTNRL
jgi:apolipoprotein D and lipocalin family protein